MKNTPRIASVDKTEKSAQIDRIIGDVMRQRNAGLDPDDSAIERDYPDLLPELGQRLRTLRALEAAARQARQQSSGASIVGGSTPFEEDLDFLRRTLLNYEILGPINYGGQGVVYKAIQRSTRRLAAIKVLLDGPLAPEGRRHRFAREVELISRLQHPNIVTVYESGVLRGRGYLAMEYVEGLPIDDYILLHSLPVADVVRLFVTVCRAVSHAHQHGIIHRDLNPANILVDLEGAPHILDFGLAKDIWTDGGAHERSFLTMPGQVVGTLPYLSPEQAGAQDREVDVRSDIYSLAVVLFELLTSGFPYPVDGDPAAVRDNIVSREPLRLRKAISPDRAARTSGGASLIRDLEMVLLKALSKDKAHRYQSAAALADDLERCLAGEVVEARADNRFYLLHRTFRKYRTAVASAVLLVLVLGAFAAIVSVLWFNARAERDNARHMARLAYATLHDVITELDDAISPLAGGTEVRDRLLNRVVAGRLAEMSPLVESDVAMEDLRAGLHEKQGDIAYAAGHHSEAAVRFEAFLRIARQAAQAEPSADDRLLDVARAHRKLARVSEDATTHVQHAVEIGQKVVNRRPHAMEPKYALCETLVEFGRQLFRGGYYQRAAEQIDAALATAKSGLAVNHKDERWNGLLAKAYELDGDIRFKLGDGERAIPSLSEALRIHRELSEARPADANRHHQVLITCAKLGTILLDDGQPEQAQAILEEAVSAGQYLTAVDPTVAAWQRGLFGAYYRLARLCLSEDKPKQARPYCDAAVELANRLVNREPDNAEWRETLAYSYILHGQVLLKAEQPSRAYNDFQAALDVRQGLCSANPDDPVRKERLAASHTWLGWCSRELGRPQRALDQYQRAYDIREALLVMQPDVTQRTLDFILSKTKLAVGYMQLNTTDSDEIARTLLEEAAASLDELRDSGKLEGRAGIYSSWMTAIHKNLALLAERTRPGTQPEVASPHPEPLQASPGEGP